MFKVGDKVVRKATAKSNEWDEECRKCGLVPVADFVVTSIGSCYICLKGLSQAWDVDNFEQAQATQPEPEYTGGSSSYYTVDISNPTTKVNPAYTAECNDIIEALGMNYAEGNAFKALWRRAAQRTLGKAKAGAKADGLYDAEKVEFFGARLVEQSKLLKVD